MTRSARDALREAVTEAVDDEAWIDEATVMRDIDRILSRLSEGGQSGGAERRDRSRSGRCFIGRKIPILRMISMCPCIMPILRLDTLGAFASFCH